MIFDSPGKSVDNREKSVLVRFAGTALCLLFMLLLSTLVVVLTVGRDPSSPMLSVVLVTSTTVSLIAYVSGRTRGNTFWNNSEARAPTSIPVTHSYTFSAEVNDKRGGSEFKNSAPMSSIVTTTTSTSGTATPSIIVAIRSAMAIFSFKSSTDGDYTAVSLDNSIHSKSDVVTGVAVI